MKRLMTICAYLCLVVFHASAQEPVQVRIERKFFLQTGVNLNYPLHDDMIQTHRLGAGLGVLGGYRFNPNYGGGIRVGFDYHWPRRHFPENYSGNNGGRLAYSILTIQWSNMFFWKKNWIGGLDMGYGLPDTKGQSGGLGWIEEYDGVTRNYLATTLSLGKIITPKWKSPLIISLVYENLFGEGHAESMGKLRLECRF